MSIPDLQNPRFNIFYQSLVTAYGPAMSLVNLADLLGVSLSSLHVARGRGLYLFPCLPSAKELRFLTIDVASHLFASLDETGQKRPRSPRRGRRREEASDLPSM